MDDRALWPRDRVLHLLTLGRRYGVPDAAVLAGTGLAAGDLAGPVRPVTPVDEQVVVRNLLARTDPALPLPLEAGFHFHLSAIGTWGTAMRAAPDLASAIAFGLTSDAALSGTVGLTAEAVDDEVVLRFEDRHLPEDVRLFMTVRMMVFLAMTALELLGEHAPVTRVAIRAPKAGFAAALAEFYRAEIAWDAPETEVAVSTEVLSRPLAAAEPAVFVRAARASARLIRAEDPVAERVRELLRAGVSADQVAARLALAPRSLRRRLQAEGTSMRELVARELTERACAQLRAGHPVAAVAAELGYSEAASFSRAFKTWTGLPPDAWRREHA